MGIEFNFTKLLCLAGMIFLFSTCTFAQAMSSIKPMLKSDPWTESQLIEPLTLTKDIADPSKSTITILNIGAVEDIKGAIHIGAANNPENLKKMDVAVVNLPKNKLIIIYCGCCPFPKCPNIHPAFSELKKLGFTNVKVLDLPVNLHTDWIAKGYPLAAK